MGASGGIGTIILIITGLVTYKGLKDFRFFDRYAFEVDGILMHRQYDRLFTSGFLHANWIHFGFNMIALASFSFSLELTFGMGRFILLYFLCMLGGSLLALFIHREHGDYRAVGASGAISGVIFSSVILYPESNIGFVLLPIEIRSWVFGLLFIIISIWGIKNKGGNIGHEAHLGGAITGILVTILLRPSVVQTNLWIILLLLIPTGLFLLLIIRNPAVLLISNYWGEWWRQLKDSAKSSGSQAPPSRWEMEMEMNALLDKIRQQGMSSLSTKERKRLKDLREELYGE